MTGPVIVEDAYAERTWGFAEAVFEAAREAGPAARYGSAAWHALDPMDPRWLAAIVRHAEAWREHVDPVTIALEVAEDMNQRRAELRQASWAVSGAGDWCGVADRPTYTELRRRRRGAA